MESQKGGSGEGSWEAFWGRKTVPKVVFEGCMMVLEKDTNFDAKMKAPGFLAGARASGTWELGAPFRDSKFQISETRNQMSGNDRCQNSVIILLARLRPFAGSGHGGGYTKTYISLFFLLHFFSLDPQSLLGHPVYFC